MNPDDLKFKIKPNQPRLLKERQSYFDLVYFESLGAIEEIIQKSLYHSTL